MALKYTFLFLLLKKMQPNCQKTHTVCAQCCVIRAGDIFCIKCKHTSTCRSNVWNDKRVKQSPLNYWSTAVSILHGANRSNTRVVSEASIFECRFTQLKYGHCRYLKAVWGLWLYSRLLTSSMGGFSADRGTRLRHILQPQHIAEGQFGGGTYN